MQAVIVSFDSIAANSLGCYGNDWVESPNWDRLAASGVVFDRHCCDVIGPLAGLAWATGKHSSSRNVSLPSPPLGSLLRSNGIATRLVTATENAAWQCTADFDAVTVVAGRDGFDSKPDEVPFAQVVKAGLGAWQDSSLSQQPRLLWLHSPSPGRPPKGFDSLYFEDFFERGVDLAPLAGEELSSHPAVYGGSISLIDHWLGELLQAVSNVDRPTMIIVMAAQGHLWQPIPSFQPGDSQIERPMLSDQRTQAPLALLVIGDPKFEQIKSSRFKRLVQTIDLVPTLLDWFGLSTISTGPQPMGQSWLRESTGDVPAREFLWISDNEGCDAIRTAQWLCLRDTRLPAPQVESTSQPTSAVSLYAKPEDIWDVNDVAAQYPEIVSDLLRHIP